MGTLFESNSSHQINYDDNNIAYALLSLKGQVCFNCSCTNTPQWRKGFVFTDQIVQKVNLCNACGLKYGKNQFCSYCYKIYDFVKNINTQEIYSCSRCGKMDHQKCVGHLDKTNTLNGVNYVCKRCRK